VLLGWLVAGEVVTTQSLVAMGIIVFGFVLATACEVRSLRTKSSLYRLLKRS
jgi:hypothetical protein